MTRLYKLAGDTLSPVPSGRLANEALIENWVAQDPSLLMLDILIIGRQVVTPFGGRIDLLGIDIDGNLAIVELKRDRTPREIIAQILDYASWVSGLSTREVHEIALAHLERRLDIAFRERFEATLPQNLNENHTMVIVASAFDQSSQRIVRYLSEVHDIAINILLLRLRAERGNAADNGLAARSNRGRAAVRSENASPLAWALVCERW